MDSAPPNVALLRERADPEIHLLNGGAEAFPAMLDAIHSAQKSVSLEIYTFALDGIGFRFVDALNKAAARGVAVQVTVDGWGSFSSARDLKSVLRGCGVKVYNPITGLLSGKLWRNHRKILLVDGRVAFIGGINIADAYADQGSQLGWVDLAVRLCGPAVRQLSEQKRRGPMPEIGRMMRWRFRRPRGGSTGPESLRVYMSGFRGGGRMRQRYLKAIRGAGREILLAHAYFFPNIRFVRALRGAALRGIRVRLLLAGKSDVGVARAATMRLYQKLLTAGVEIHEWTDSTLHAKTAVVDGRLLLLGSFNLDPLSLVNLETLVEAEDLPICQEVAAWVEAHLARSRQVTLADCVRSPLQRWLTDRLGLLMARLIELCAHYLGRNSRRALAKGKRPLLRHERTLL